MKLRHAFTTLAIAAALGAVVTPAAAAEPVATIDFTAEQGAHPVDGRTGHWVGSSENEVRAYELGDTLRVDGETDHGFDHLRLDFSAPSGALQEGTYDHAGGARILAVSNGLGCVDDYSAFTISRVERDAGRLTALDVTFEQRCGDPAAPALRGEAHYRR